jgi:hypothetical protein
MEIKSILFYIIAAVLGSLSTSAHAQEVYGNPQDPLAAEVLGTEVHTRDADEMRYVILSKLVDRYAAEHDIDVDREEIDAYLESMRRTMENHHKKNLARREELARKLASQGLTDAERQQLTSELDSLNELIATLEEGEGGSSEDAEEEKEYREEVAAAFIRQWKINRALFRQYGGRVIFQQGGPEPLDAYRRFLEEQEEKGAFAIVDRALGEKFWYYYRNDAIHSFYPPGSEEEKKAFDTPWWLQDKPRE